MNKTVKAYEYVSYWSGIQYFPIISLKEAGYKGDVVIEVKRKLALDKLSIKDPVNYWCDKCLVEGVSEK
jgi:hypothetical protein